MIQLGINFDEISDDLDEAIAVMKKAGIQYGELRTLNKKNFVFWDDAEVGAFRAKIAGNGITVVAASTPLFKWYVNEGDPEVRHDSFGFNPRLGESKKRETIDRAIEIAHFLDIPRLRIFSGLGKAENAGKKFAKDALLGYALDKAAEHHIDLYLENEPTCRVHTKADVLDLFADNTRDNLKFWLDIANLEIIGEFADDPAFLEQISPRLGYVHVKDFVTEDNTRRFVPVGEGQIDYPGIMSLVTEKCGSDFIVTVETHAKSDKVGNSLRSIEGTRKVLEG